MPKMTFVQTDGSRREVDAPTGLTVLDIAHLSGIDGLAGICEGCMACSTCHVVVDSDWFVRLDAPSEDEEDVLDMVFELEETSRLGCQVEMSDALDGLTVRVPGAHRNLLME